MGLRALVMRVWTSLLRSLTCAVWLT